MNRTKKWIVFSMAVFMVSICFWSLAGAEEIPEDVLFLELDQPAFATIEENGVAEFRFVPEKTGVYEFYAFDPYVSCSLFLFESESYLYIDRYFGYAEAEGGQQFDNFLKEGKQYLYRLSYYEDSEWTGTFPVKIKMRKDTRLTASAVGKTNITVAEGQPVTLEVAAGGGSGELTYCWLDEFDEVIEGQTADTFVLEDITQYIYDEWSCYITCCVSDQTGQKVYVKFTIELEHEDDWEEPVYSYAEAVDSDLWVKPGGTTKLKVKAYSEYGDDISYQWYELLDYDEEEEEYGAKIKISKATKATYTTKEIWGKKYYLCKVQDDYNLREHSR